MNTNSLIASLNLWFAKTQFGTSSRIEFYETLALMLENRVLVAEALSEMCAVASRNGKNMNQPMAIIMNDCLESINQGASLADALGPWVDSNEVGVLAAGERSGDLSRAVYDVIALLKAQQRIMAAVVGASMYPLVLLAMLAMLLHIVATSLVPKLSSVSKPETWEGPAYLLYLISNFVNSYGTTVVVSLVMIVVLIWISLPRLGGGIRVALDGVPPWSIYRDIHGAIFMLNVSLLIGSGLMLQQALELLRDRAASSWLRVRIEATLERIAAGRDLGQALEDSNLNFPSARAISYLKLFSKRSGFDASMSNFAKKWLDKTIDGVQGASKIFLLATIILMGGMLTLVVGAVSSIESAIEQSTVQ
ncbi:hypothetical protein AB870_16065 [Pandoraea faecigallinarum]|uniref:Type II secretion system protein GspF domain-containing protein n=1 Tax=Pandoraea faecigallinarum TaxID=656179 RepID=A0A0H3WXR5_9BURK|nr:type II secretion system F family protein [Pandoraea faecigallinarum]AKM31316.1 hypothetical protein AB870_16065 [Pandoraea faecigallinarum]